MKTSSTNDDIQSTFSFFFAARRIAYPAVWILCVCVCHLVFHLPITTQREVLLLRAAVLRGFYKYMAAQVHAVRTPC